MPLPEPQSAAGSTGLSPSRRALGLLLAYGLWFAATPGALNEDGLPLLGALAVGLWALVVRRPGPWSGPIDWALGGVGLVAPTAWMAYVFLPSPAIAALGLGVYALAAGYLLRRLERAGLPFVLAAALAWTSLETLRDVLEPPFGFGWLRLGHLFAAWPWGLGAARWIGVEGLSLALAALGAGLVQALLGRRFGRGSARGREIAWALLPLLGVGLCAALSQPPATEPGPRLLVLQPNVDVWDKHDRASGLARFKAHLALTREGLEAARRDGAPIDLVLWPETSLPIYVGDLGLEASIRQGVDFAPWRGPEWRGEDLLGLEANERELLERWIWPSIEGVPAFLAGAERWTARTGELRRENAACLWNRSGQPPRQDSLKRALAPGGETVFGLESWGFLRERIQAAAGYLPDLLAGEHSRVLSFVGVAGRSYGVLATVCFDNAHQYPYLDGLAQADADFIAVLSNEAWYHQGVELDQMVAFSRALAVITGRSLVRSTNDGVSLCLGPDGRELGRLEVGGRDRGVAGTAVFQVPVPVPGSARPPYGAFARWWRSLWIAAPLLFLLVRSGRTRNHPQPAG